jgi:hypothetical protein
MPGIQPRRERDPDVCAASLAVLGRRGAAVSAGDSVDDRETEPRPLRGASLVGASEALERDAQKLRVEAVPLVAHVQLDEAVTSLGLEPNVTATVAQCVLDEIPNRPLDVARSTSSSSASVSAAPRPSAQPQRLCSRNAPPPRGGHRLRRS